MAKHFTFKDTDRNRILYEAVVPNFIDEKEVIEKMIKETGKDPRFLPHCEKTIRAVDDSFILRKKNSRKRKN